MEERFGFRTLVLATERCVISGFCALTVKTGKTLVSLGPFRSLVPGDAIAALVTHSCADRGDAIPFERLQQFLGRPGAERVGALDPRRGLA